MPRRLGSPSRWSPAGRNCVADADLVFVQSQHAARVPDVAMWDWKAGKLIDEPVPGILGEPKGGRYELKRSDRRSEVIIPTLRPSVLS